MKYLAEIKKYQPFNEQERVDKEMIISFIKKNSNVLLRESSIAHLTVSSWIVNQHHNKILLAFHNIYNSWSWTGGHADGDSNLLNVALQEAKEETGIKTLKPLSNEIFSLESLCVNGHVKNGVYVASHLHLNITYLLEANDEEELHVKTDENKQVAWFSFDEALKAPNEEWMVDYIYKKLTDKLNLLLKK